MKVLIINLPRYEGSSVTREGRCELILDYRVDTPATLLIIASLLRNENQSIKFIDANGLNLSYNDLLNLLKIIKFECLIFTFNSQIIDYELRICSIIKRINPSCITVGYSWYARKFGNEILNEYDNLDILIVDDPFSIVGGLIKCLNSHDDLSKVNGIAFRNDENEITLNEKLIFKKKFNDLPLPAYDLLRTFKRYYIYSPLLSPYALVYAGKGCPFGCVYCNVANTIYSGKSAEKIIHELKILRKLGKVKYVWFFDEVFTINRRRTVEICKRIIKEGLKIKWFCDSRVDLVDKELLILMRKAGCIGISYGVESGSNKILNLMNKKITIEQAKKVLRWTRQVNIPIQLNLLVGYIGETKATLKETENFIREVMPEFIQVSIMQAHESTEFIKIALENNWIRGDLDWKKRLTAPHKKLRNYKPFELNLWELRESLPKMLVYNPKWWFHTIKTLMRNLSLIKPIFYTFLRKSQTISLI